MIKKENANFILPDCSWAAGPHSSTRMPPGFPPKICTSDAQFSRNQNLTCKENQKLDFCEESPRRTSRKRSRPKFYKPPTAPPPPPGPRRRGRPPKAGYQSPLVRLETETRNSNQVSSIPLSLRVNDEVAEHGSQISTGNISVDGIRPRAVQSSSFHAEDIKETLIDVSLMEMSGPVSNENAWSFSRNYQISEGIDPKILQHVANALQYMTGSQTALDDAKVISRSSDINRNLVHTLKAINKKHGDITQDCSLESDCMKTLVLLGICKVVQDLQRKQLKDLDISSLDSYYTAVRDAENMKVNVQWLRSRLDEIKDAFNLSDEAKGFMTERDRRVGSINRKKKDLERLKSEVQDIEEQLDREVVMVEELNKKFGDQMSKISWFQHANLMDGLI